MHKTKRVNRNVPDVPATLRCWNCGEQTQLGYDLRYCGHCGAELSVERYDEAAHAKGLEASDSQRGYGQAKQALEQATDYVNEKWLRRILPFSPARLRMNKARRAFEVAEEHKRQTYRELHELAWARYFSAPWFRLTGMGLARSEHSTAALEDVTYNELGTFLTFPNFTRKESRGAYGEYELMRELEELVASGRLGHARIVPRTFLPYSSGRGHDIKMYNREVDLILITQGPIFIIESKRCHADLSAHFDGKANRYRVTPMGPHHDNNIGPSQTSINRHCFVNLGFRTVDRYDVKGVTVYSNTTSFALRSKNGIGGLYLATDEKNELNVLDVITSAYDLTRDVRTPSEVDWLYRKVVHYCDQTGWKRRLRAKLPERSSELRKASGTNESSFSPLRNAATS